MSKLVQVRAMTAEEVETIERLVHARTEAVRTVERARIISLSRHGQRVRAMAKAVGVCEATVRLWIKRFNAAGLAALADEPRSGRPPTYTSEQVGQVIAASLTPPRELGLPFGSWTLDRLAVYLHEQQAIPIKRSRIDELLLEEGLRWRHEETWFGERVDPAFAEKRGPSRRSTPSLRRAV